jgi:hypothetical protein
LPQNLRGKTQPRHATAAAERPCIPLGLELVKDSSYLENREYLIGRGDRDARDEMPSRLASPVVKHHRPSPHKHLCLGLGFRAQSLGTTWAAKTTVSTRSGVFQRFRIQGSGSRNGPGRLHKHQQGFGSGFKVQGSESRVQGSGFRVF